MQRNISKIYLGIYIFTFGQFCIFLNIFKKTSKKFFTKWGALCHRVC